MDVSLSSELYGVPEVHGLLEMKVPQYSMTTLNRAYLVWNKMGCKSSLPHACNYYHQLEKLEKLLTDEQRRKSINLEVILSKHDPPKSKFFLRLFPNIYPKPKNHSSEQNDDILSAVTNVSETPSSSTQSTDPAAPIDIYFITNLIREFCEKHNKTQKQFLDEFKAYANQCQMNLTVSNVAFYIKYQNVLLGKDVVKSELKANNRVEDIEITPENRHIIEHIQEVLEPPAPILVAQDNEDTINTKTEEKINGAKTDDESESFCSAMSNLKLDCSGASENKNKDVNPKIIIPNDTTHINGYLSNNNILLGKDNVELIRENKDVLKEKNTNGEMKVNTKSEISLVTTNNDVKIEVQKFSNTLNYASAVMKESSTKKNVNGFDKIKAYPEMKIIKNVIDKPDQNSPKNKEVKRNKNVSKKENIKQDKTFANFHKSNIKQVERKRTNSNLNKSFTSENISSDQSFVFLNNSFSGIEDDWSQKKAEINKKKNSTKTVSSKENILNNKETNIVENGKEAESSNEMEPKTAQFATSFDELVNVNANQIKNTKPKKQKKKKVSKKERKLIKSESLTENTMNNEERQLRDITNTVEEKVPEQEMVNEEEQLRNFALIREARKQEAIALAESVKKMALNMQRLKVHFIENKSSVDPDKLMREIFETETKIRGKKKKNMANVVADMLDNELEGLFGQISGLVDDSDTSSTYDADQIEKNLNLTSEIRRKVTKLFDKVNKNLERLNINLSIEEFTYPDIETVQKKDALVRNDNKAGPSGLNNVSRGSDSLVMMSCTENESSVDEACNISADFRSLDKRRFSTSSQ